MRNNGTYAGSSGNYESYTFRSNGTVEYTSLIAVQNYGCRLEVFGQQDGRAGVDGGKLEVYLDNGTVGRDDSCSPSKNYTNPLKAANYSYDWRIEDDGYGNTQLVLTQPNGESFYYRKAN